MTGGCKGEVFLDTSCVLVSINLADEVFKYIKQELHLNILHSVDTSFKEYF